MVKVERAEDLFIKMEKCVLFFRVGKKH